MRLQVCNAIAKEEVICAWTYNALRYHSDASTKNGSILGDCIAAAAATK